MAGDSLEIRSFRSVFALERRIYRIDNLRLNPAGVPLRGIGYAAGLGLAALIAGATPPTAWLDPLVPWYVRDLALPIALATLLGSCRVDGRPVHVAALAALGHTLSSRRFTRLAPCRRARGRWHPPPILCLPDGSDASFRALRYRGPGAVLVARPHVRAEWSRRHRAAVTLHPLAGGGTGSAVIELAAGAVLEVRPR